MTGSARLNYPHLPRLLRLMPNPLGGCAGPADRHLRLKSPYDTVIVSPKQAGLVAIEVTQQGLEDEGSRAYNVAADDRDLNESLKEAFRVARGLSRYAPVMDSLSQKLSSYDESSVLYDLEWEHFSMTGKPIEVLEGLSLADFGQSEVSLGIFDSRLGEYRVNATIMQPADDETSQCFSITARWSDDDIIQIAYYDLDYNRVTKFRPILDIEVDKLKSLVKTWRMHCIPETTFGWQLEPGFLVNFV